MLLEQYLLELMRIWAATTGGAVTTLGARLANDGKLYGRLAAGRSITTSLFQSSLSFFRDGANWPDGSVPETACDLLENFSNIALPAPGGDATPLPDGELPPHISSPGRAGEAGAEEPARCSAPAERAGQDAGDMAA